MANALKNARSVSQITVLALNLAQYRPGGTVGKLIQSIDRNFYTMDTSARPIEGHWEGHILMKRAFNTLDERRKPRPLGRRRLYSFNLHKQRMVSPGKFQ